MNQACSICSLSFEPDLADEKSRHPLSDPYVKSTILDALQGQKLAHVIFLNEYHILIILSQEELGQEEITLKQFAQKLFNRFQLYHSLSPIIIYDWNIADYENARCRYLDFKDIWQLRFYEDRLILDAKKVHLLHYISFVQYKDLAREIRNNRQQDMDKSLNLLTSIIERCRQENVYPEILRMLFIKVLEFLEFLEKSVTIETHDFLSEKRTSLYHCTTSQELLSYMSTALQAMFTALDEDMGKDGTHYRVEVLQVIDYILENYQHKITLNSISKHVNLSSTYLCRIFKSEVGISINNYINNLRMEKAGELISREKLPVKEVAICVGIEDQLYFSRLFKKHFGMPPSEY